MKSSMLGRSRVDGRGFLRVDINSPPSILDGDRERNA